jgi:hypothetical protein
LPKVIGLVGTLAVCAAALLGHLSPPELKTAAVGFWLVGLRRRRWASPWRSMSTATLAHRNTNRSLPARKPAAPEPFRTPGVEPVSE